jgi:hypothetical protein
MSIPEYQKPARHFPSLSGIVLEPVINPFHGKLRNRFFFLLPKSLFADDSSILPNLVICATKNWERFWQSPELKTLMFFLVFQTRAEKPLYK